LQVSKGEWFAFPRISPWRPVSTYQRRPQVAPALSELSGRIRIEGKEPPQVAQGLSVRIPGFAKEEEESDLPSLFDAGVAESDLMLLH